MVDFGRCNLECGNRPGHRSSLKHVRDFPGHRLLENLAHSIGRSHRYGIAQDDSRASRGLGRNLLPIICLMRHRYLTPVCWADSLFRLGPQRQPRLCGIAHRADKYLALQAT
jgi:hypothetical protein